MKILGIETSCDETAVSLIDATGTPEQGDFTYTILGNTLLSQAALHAQYGGVYPNLAKREHAKNLIPILERALEEAGQLRSSEKPLVDKNILDELKRMLEREPELFARLTIFLSQYQKPDVDAIAVTTGPGLEPALWVGINFARALARAWNLPIVDVNHMEGHIIISSVRDNTLAPLTFPALALLISGGHTELVLLPAWLTYKKLGHTRDDAVGEAFDKTARLLDLPYPGGPHISKSAAEARERDIRLKDLTLPRPMLNSGDADFSFSGLKTAVRLYVQEHDKLTDEQKAGVAREFEDAVADVFAAKVRNAVEAHGVHTLILGGGVSANTYLKERLARKARELGGVTLLVSPPERATDNALMIALAGYFHAARGTYANPTALRANGNRVLA